MVYELEKMLAMVNMIVNQPAIMLVMAIYVLNEVWLTIKAEIRLRGKRRNWDSPDYIIDTSRVEE